MGDKSCACLYQAGRQAKSLRVLMPKWHWKHRLPCWATFNSCLSNFCRHWWSLVTHNNEAIVATCLLCSKPIMFFVDSEFTFCFSSLHVRLGNLGWNFQFCLYREQSISLIWTVCQASKRSGGPWMTQEWLLCIWFTLDSNKHNLCQAQGFSSEAVRYGILQKKAFVITNQCLGSSPVSWHIF